eukprot:TRINITY_DN7233_c0_g1_i1.p1 TRINITY_DN7233_c0_g1~~TRINITY_DN7233_c0_g1_i1.p1  ORF type:complete len:338 (+),score=115.84 TRINITY_DN7233_c0_g1_i1:154-1167(+)
MEDPLNVRNDEFRVDIEEERESFDNAKPLLQHDKQRDEKNSLENLEEENEFGQCPLDPLRKCSSTENRAVLALKITLLLIVISGGITLLALFFFSESAKAFFLNGISWMAALPQPASSFLMMAIYATCLLFFCPGTPFNLACGFMFGVYIGSIVATAGCMLGSIAAYFAGKTIARDWVNEQMKKRPSFGAIDRAIEKNGLYIVFLTRLSPLFPFPLLNFAFGSTQVRFWQYVLGTLGGILPATIGYTYLGTLIKSVTQVLGSDDDEDSKTDLIIAIVGSVITVASIVIISWITKRAIDNATKEEEPQEIEFQLLKQNSSWSNADALSQIETIPTSDI